MKKILSLIIVVVVLSAMTLTAFAEVEYMAHEVKITVNGTQHTVLGYNVPGSQNGVKIRTIAAILNGTSKQFNVTFNDGVVNIIPGEGYTQLGAEFETYTGNEPGGIYSTHIFKVNGEYAGIEATLASDYNYLPLENFIYSILGSVVINYDESGNVIIDTEAELSDEDWG